jgi:hypothetical protein
MPATAIAVKTGVFMPLPPSPGSMIAPHFPPR